MGESGPGTAHHTIIDRPEIKSWHRRFIETAVTLLLWGVWLYWILPIVVIILWLVGVPSPAQRIFTRGTFAQLHAVLVTSGLALLLIALAELLWIGYNRLVRRRRGRRRRKVPAITYRHLYESAGLAKGTVEKAQKLRRLEITLTDGKLAVANLDDPTALRRKPPARRLKRSREAELA